MYWKFWKSRNWRLKKFELKNLFPDEPICLKGELKLDLVERYIKLYDSIDYLDYEIEMEISEVQTRHELYKKINIFSIISTFVGIITNIITNDIIEKLNHKDILLPLVITAAILVLILSIKLTYDSKAYKRWWFTSYFICAVVFTVMVYCFGVWHILDLVCSLIIIFTLFTSFINYKATECRARLVALNYIKIKHNIK